MLHSLTQRKITVYLEGSYGFKGVHNVSVVNNLHEVQETQERWVQSVDQGDPPEKEMATNPLQYSCLKNPMDRGAW